MLTPWKPYPVLSPSLIQLSISLGFTRKQFYCWVSVIWPPHAKSWLVGKDPDAGRDWGQEEKGTTEDEMAGWHHQLDGHEFESTPGVGDGQGGMACCDSWGHKELDTTERLNWTELIGDLKGELTLLYCALKWGFIRYACFIKKEREKNKQLCPVGCYTIWWFNKSMSWTFPVHCEDCILVGMLLTLFVASNKFESIF